jgi:cold shock protein
LIVVTGKVVRFDVVRGYGFVSPTHGGDDVFLHVNDLAVDKSLIRPGVMVEFEIEDGDRGLKAADVRLVEGAAAPVGFTPAQSFARVGVEDGLCDVLSVKEFTEEVTETLLTTAPGLTAEQILRIRERLTKLASNHGWVEA